MDNELNNLNDDNKSENNNVLLENNNQENQINYKSNKWKKILIGIIVLIVIFIIALTIYVFVINKNVNKDNIGQGNNNVEDSNQNISYKMEKILDSLGNEHTANSIKETEKYYILKTDNKFILYDKNGIDVTKQVFGTSDISYIDGISSYDKNDILLVRTSSDHYGLYDKNFNEIVKISNHVIERTNSENYFFVGDRGNSRFLENVGIYDKSGNLVISNEYERLFLLKNSDKILFYAKKNGKCGIIDEKNNIIIPFEYDYDGDKIMSYSSHLVLDQISINENKNYILLKNGKRGMVDSNNNVIIDFDKDNLSYSKYANVIIEVIDANSKMNVYNLNGKLEKTIELGNNLKYEGLREYYKFDTRDSIFYDDEYIYLLNSNLEFEKYVKPYEYSACAGDGCIQIYLSGPNVYLKSKDDIKFKIYNTKDNNLMFKEEFYLLKPYSSSDIQAFILCKEEVEVSRYSKCGIVGYDGKIISNFDFVSSGENLISKTEKIVINQNDNNWEWYIKKIGINGNCRINNDIYEVENNVVITYEGNTESVYNSSCNLILNSETNDYSSAYSLNYDLVMAEKYKTKDNPAIYKIYNSSNGELANIGNNDGAIITNGVIGRTLNDEPIVSTDKGIYKIVKE